VLGDRLGRFEGLGGGVDVLPGCLATESTMLVVCGSVVGREGTGEAEG
jgi:hypothetical protein